MTSRNELWYNDVSQAESYLPDRKAHRMTLVVAVTNGREIVLACDTRKVIQDESGAMDRSIDGVKKYVKLANRCVLALWGNRIELSQAFLERAIAKRKNQLTGVQDIAQDMSSILEKAYFDRFYRVSEDMQIRDFRVQFCIVGLDITTRSCQ